MIILELSEDRDKRIEQLKSALETDMCAHISEKVGDSLKGVFESEEVAAKIKEFNLPIPTSVRAEFCNEYDDSGGYDKRIDWFGLYLGDKRISDQYEEATWEEHDTDWRGNPRINEVSVYDLISDWIRDSINGYAEEICEYFGMSDVNFDLEVGQSAVLE